MGVYFISESSCCGELWVPQGFWFPRSNTNNPSPPRQPRNTSQGFVMRRTTSRPSILGRLVSPIGIRDDSNAPALHLEDLSKLLDIHNRRLARQQAHQVSVASDASDFRSVLFLETGTTRSRAVCRIVRTFSKSDFVTLIETIQAQTSISASSDFNSASKLKEVLAIPDRLTDEIFKPDIPPLDALKAISEETLAKLNPIPVGTGFLVGDSYLLTNHHVISSPDDAAQCTAQFNYVEGSVGYLSDLTEYEFAPRSLFITNPDLDYTLVALQSGMFTRPAGYEFGWISMIEDEQAIAPGLTYLQGHPTPANATEFSKKLRSVAEEQLRNTRLDDQYRVSETDRLDNASALVIEQYPATLQTELGDRLRAAVQRQAVKHNSPMQWLTSENEIEILPGLVGIVMFPDNANGTIINAVRTALTEEINAQNLAPYYTLQSLTPTLPEALTCPMLVVTRAGHQLGTHFAGNQQPTSLENTLVNRIKQLLLTNVAPIKTVHVITNFTNSAHPVACLLPVEQAVTEDMITALQEQLNADPQFSTPAEPYVIETVTVNLYSTSAQSGNSPQQRTVLVLFRHGSLSFDEAKALDALSDSLQTQTIQTDSPQQTPYSIAPYVKSLPGEPVFIIQHPRGEQKRIVLNDNRVLPNGLYRDFLRYSAESDYGSSGSPVFNSDWQLVALHHSAIVVPQPIPNSSDENGFTLKTVAQQGVRICRIIADLKQKSVTDSILSLFVRDFIITAEQIAYPPFPASLRFDGLRSYAIVNRDINVMGATQETILPDAIDPYSFGSPEGSKEYKLFTVEAWVNPYPGGSGGTIVGKWEEPKDSPEFNRKGEYRLSVARDGSFIFSREPDHFCPNIKVYDLTSTKPIPFGQFSHVAVVSHGRNTQLYINGQLDIRTFEVADASTDEARPEMVPWGEEWFLAVPFDQGQMQRWSIHALIDDQGTVYDRSTFSAVYYRYNSKELPIRFVQVNGLLELFSPTPSDPITPLLIGAHVNHPDRVEFPEDAVVGNFEGLIAEVRIWSTNRTASEIQQTMYQRLRGNEVGLVGYWRLEDGQGDRIKNQALTAIANLSNPAPAYGKVVDATWVNASEFPSLPLPYSLWFNGNDSYVDCGNDVRLGITHAITLEAWVKHEVGNGVIVSRGGFNPENTRSTQAGNGYSLSWWDDKIRVEFRDGTRELVVDTLERAPNDRAWHHIAMTWGDRTTLVREQSNPSSYEVALYIDGKRQNVVVVEGMSDSAVIAGQYRTVGIFQAPLSPPAVNLTIGCHQVADHTCQYFFQGAIAEVRLWNVARTHAQIKTQLYNRLEVDIEKQKGLIGYWRLDDGDTDSRFNVRTVWNLVNSTPAEIKGKTLGYPTLYTREIHSAERTHQSAVQESTGGSGSPSSSSDSSTTNPTTVIRRIIIIEEDGSETEEIITSDVRSFTASTPPPTTPSLAGMAGVPSIFRDVPATHWAIAFLNRMAQLQIIQGNAENNFNPDAQTTVLQYAATMARAMEKTNLISARILTLRPSLQFQDLDQTDLVWNDTQKVYQYGFLVVLASNLRVFPTRTLTRVVALAHLVTGLKLALSNSADTQTILQVYRADCDVHAMNEPLKRLVATATQSRLVVSRHPSQTQFNEPITRAELAAMIYQALLVAGVQDIQAIASPAIISPP